MSDVRITAEGHVGIAEITRAPNNYFDIPLIRALAGAFQQFDADPAIRSILLCSEGKNFCAGADFSVPPEQTVGDRQGGNLYQQAVRLFRVAKPVVAAVQGAAVGGGLGLSLVADFRVASPESRFTANFNRLGFHPGFGMSITLPRVVGEQKAALLFYTGRRISGEEAHAMGLVDVLAPQPHLRAAALALAAEIAQSAPLAVMATRSTLRRGLADEIAAITDHELSQQQLHFETADFKEGVRAMAERRAPVFEGGSGRRRLSIGQSRRADKRRRHPPLRAPMVDDASLIHPTTVATAAKEPAIENPASPPLLGRAQHRARRSRSTIRPHP